MALIVEKGPFLHLFIKKSVHYSSKRLQVVEIRATITRHPVFEGLALGLISPRKFLVERPLIPDRLLWIMILKTMWIVVSTVLSQNDGSSSWSTQTYQG